MGVYASYIEKTIKKDKTLIDWLKKVLPIAKKQLENRETNANSLNSQWAKKTNFLESLIDRHAAKFKFRQSSSDPRIVHFIGNLQAGGAERQLCNCVIGQKKLGLNTAVWVLHPPRGEHGHYYSLLAENGVPIKIVGERLHQNFSKLYTANNQLHKIIKEMPTEFKPMCLDIMGELMIDQVEIFHAWLDHPNIWGGVGALLADVPFLVFSTRNKHPMNFPYLATPYFLPVYKQFLKSPAVRFINNSRPGARSYCRWLAIKEKKFSVILNGVDLNGLSVAKPKAAKAWRKKTGVPESAKMVAGIFRLSEEKKPMVFLEVARKLLKKCENLYFVVAGVGPLETKMRKYIEKYKLLKRIILVGRCKNINVIYSTASLVLLCSRHEGTPNVLLESQWLGCPVVATRAGGAVDTVEDGKTGFLVKIGNTCGLIRASIRLLEDDSLRKKFSRRGPKFIQKRFGLNRMVRETIDIYSPFVSPNEFFWKAQDKSHAL